MSHIVSLLCLSLLVLVWVPWVACECPRGCSSRGLCINNACVCAEGLSGADCSINVPSDRPTLYECPSCYTLTVGAPRYYSGPSWRLPDGPIVGLNYKGTLKMYQGNGNGELIAEGTEIDDWTPAPIEALKPGQAGQFDSCGSWIMRAFTDSDTGKVLGFYHAEHDCDYANNGQTRKSAGYAVSMDGGDVFWKPGYPSNKLVDTATPVLPSRPSGEGDLSVVLRGGWYYLFFANVEQYYTGVARASKASEAYPGSFRKYYNGQWNQPGVGGNSSALQNMVGPQVYLHTPSQSFVAVGNFNPYWHHGFMMSVSDDAINWNYFADPIHTPDPTTNNDMFLYPSLMAPTGGYDIGSKFYYFYMWGSLSSRYQVMKDITLTYIGENATAVGTKLALTTFRHAISGETWQSTELALSPYRTTAIVGYIMTRPYEDTFPIYDCFNYTTNDHFVGTAAECFLSGPKVTDTRMLGHVWAKRTPGSIAIYRCYAPQDLFLSTDDDCEGRADPQTVPFGYVMDGPALSNSAKGYDLLISKGSNWRYYTQPMTDLNWTRSTYNDRSWSVGTCPFGASYKNIVKTYFGRSNYYFRTNFTIPVGSTVQKLLLAVASDNYAKVYINGFLADSDPLTWHEAAYWNRRVYVNTSVLVQGLNQISVITYNLDDWSFFDLELSATFEDSVPTPPTTCRSLCVNGQCINGKCACDNGWAGDSCSLALCSFKGSSSNVVIPAGSSFRYKAWPVLSATPEGWFSPSYDDAWWGISSAPFATTFYYKNYMPSKTTIPNARHIYRKKFIIDVQYGQEIVEGILKMATDDTHRVYINGVFVGTPIHPYDGHYAKKWNDVLTVSGKFLKEGANVIAVEVPLVDGRWSAYFDMELEVTYATKNCIAPPS